MARNDLTIIIASFKSDKKIIPCLKSIGSKIKVIIIENSQNKKFKSFVEKKYKNVKCIIPKENLGYARANNLALKKITTKYALVLNPDTKLKFNTIDNFLITAKKCPDFSLIGPANNQDRIIINSNHSKKKKLIKVKNLKGFAIFFNMKKFKDKKFFDENFFLYFEEIDLCKRVTLKKGKIYLDTSIKILHTGASSVDTKFKNSIENNRNWHWMWSTFYYHKKYKNFLYAFAIVLPKIISSLLKTFFYLIIFQQKKKNIYYCRLSGLINSIFGFKSWYRPTLD